MLEHQQADERAKKPPGKYAESEDQNGSRHYEQIAEEVKYRLIPDKAGRIFAARQNLAGVESIEVDTRQMESQGKGDRENPEHSDVSHGQEPSEDEQEDRLARQGQSLQDEIGGCLSEHHASCRLYL